MNSVKSDDFGLRVTMKPIETDKLNAFNIQVLQRMDEEISKLVFTTFHVSTYVFETESTTWYHKGVKGSLFLVKRRKEPIYQLIILNREHPKNFVETITAEMIIDDNVQDYFIYRNGDNQIHGFWFYDKEAKNLFTEKLKRLTQKLKEKDKETSDAEKIPKVSTIPRS
eukprot:TRINITY_DN2599_c0_g1_i8.p1 TRINITY_DN2599_c0_g1~~TRINITY_DN2599_c0_g1_i8.p1  ORF type:complete len:168 (-),score=26.54 TRINITY_DN2599_c0_g1_i8:405-908(-)